MRLNAIPLALCVRPIQAAIGHHQQKVLFRSSTGTARASRCLSLFNLPKKTAEISPATLIVSTSPMRSFPQKTRRPSNKSPNFCVAHPRRSIVHTWSTQTLSSTATKEILREYKEIRLRLYPLLAPLMGDGVVFVERHVHTSCLMDTFAYHGGLVTLCEPNTTLYGKVVAPSREPVVCYLKRAPSSEPVEDVRKYTLNISAKTPEGSTHSGVMKSKRSSFLTPGGLRDKLARVTFSCPVTNRVKVASVDSGHTSFTSDDQYGPLRLSYWETSVSCTKRTYMRRSRRRLAKSRRSDAEACSTTVEPALRDRGSPGFWQIPSRGKYKMLGRTSIKCCAQPARYSYDELISMHPECKPDNILRSPGFALPLVKLRNTCK